MPDDLQHLVDSLARQLHRSVAVDDPRLRLISYSAHAGKVDLVRTASILSKAVPPEVASWVFGHGIREAHDCFELPANPELGIGARLGVPIRMDGDLLGYLWLLESEGHIGPDEITASVRAAAEAAIFLHRERRVGALRSGIERELLRDLLVEDRSVRIQAAAELIDAGLIVAQGPRVVMVVRVGSRTGHEPDQAAGSAIEDGLRETRNGLSMGHGIHLGRIDHGLLVVSGGTRALTDGVIREAAETLLGAVRARLATDRWSTVVGVGDTVAKLEDAHDSFHQAARAARTAQLIGLGGPVAHWADLGVYRLLSQLPPDRLTADTLPRTLLEMINRPENATLVETLETFLDFAGNTRRTAEHFGIHRVSLYGRLRRVEELTGLDLEDGQQRLAAHLGLKLARLAGLVPLKRTGGGAGTPSR